MNIKTLGGLALLSLAAAHHAPVLADGSIPANIRNCTYDPQRLDVTLDGIATSVAVPGATGKKCAINATANLAYTSLPASISATFDNQNPDLTEPVLVSCSGTVGANDTVVDINLINPSTCSFGRPKPAKPSR